MATTPTTTKAAEVGTIKVVLGDVRITGVDGVVRAACVGDKVYSKEIIQTNANAVIQVQLADGRMLDLGRDSVLALDEDLLGTPRTARTASPTDDIAALQAAIAAGADPSKIAEATAAGGNTGGSGGDNEGHDGMIVVGQANSSGVVTSGVETGGVLLINDQPIPFVPLSQQLPGITLTVLLGNPSGGSNTQQQGEPTGGSNSSSQPPASPPSLPGANPPSLPASPRPVANNDTDSIPLGGTSATGNVITGVGTRGGPDNPGAEGATVTNVTSPSGNVATIGPGGVITIVGQFGTLVINPDGSYVYTLNPGPHGAQETFTYTLTDASGDTASAILQIILGTAPDVPVARNDTDSIPLGGTSATGNVLTGAGTTGGPDALGTDGAIVTNVTSPSGNPAVVGPGGVITIVGQFGTLVINPDGSYVYTLNPGPHGGTDTFIYTVTDGNGDTSSAGLTINLGTSPNVPVAQSDTDSLLPGETTASGNVITGAGTAGGPDAVGTDGAIVTNVTSPSGNAAVVGPGGVITIVGQFGTLVINPDGSYVYTLNPGPHGATETFIYTVTDGSGDTSSAGLTINLGVPPADVPVAHNDTDFVPLGGNAATGNVITGAGTSGGPDAVGTDGAIVTGVTGSNGTQGTTGPGGVITIVGQFGTLVINPDGSYVYTLNPGPHGTTETFTYTVTDGSGDTSSAVLQINLGTSPDVPVAHNDTDFVPLGGNAATGNVITGAGTSGGPDNVGTDGAIVTGVTGSNGNQGTTGPGGVITIVGEFGTLVINPDSSYVYTLNPGPHGTTETFTYTVTDGSGDTSSAVLQINLGTPPNVPVANNDSDFIPLGGTVASGNVITGAGTSGSPDTVGTDGAVVTNVTSPSGNLATVGPGGVITIVGEFGTLVINPDGSYVYTLNPGPHGPSETFTYTLTDGSGDTSSAGLTINFGTSPQDPPGDGSDPITLTSDGVAVVEGTSPDVKVINIVLTLDQAFPDAVQITYQINPGSAQSPSDFAGVLSGTVTIPAGQTQIIVPVNIVQDHRVEGNEVFSVVLTNAVNATINPQANTVNITIVDDDQPALARDDTYNIVRGQTNNLPSVLAHSDVGEALDDSGAGPGETLLIVPGPNDLVLPNGDI